VNNGPILVTGGAGFIGSHLAARLLREGYEVHVLDDFSSGRICNVPRGAIVHEMDIRSRRVHHLFGRYSYSVLFHQAAQMNVRRSVQNPLGDTDINVMGTINLLEAARGHGLQKVIFASSGGVIYGEPERVPQDEEHPLNPLSPYGISKMTCERYLRYYWETYNLPYVALRYGNVYGERQNPLSGAGVICIFLEKMYAGARPTINGSGGKTRDYVYISDVVEANMRALQYHGIGVFNVGTGIETDVNTIFRMLRDICGLDFEPLRGPDMQGEQRRSVLDVTRIGRMLGWSPAVDLKDGLRQTVSWYREQMAQVRSDVERLQEAPA
jgi:UDP-glucose 4-epimerase